MCQEAWFTIHLWSIPEAPCEADVSWCCPLPLSKGGTICYFPVKALFPLVAHSHQLLPATWLCACCSLCPGHPSTLPSFSSLLPSSHLSALSPPQEGFPTSQTTDHSAIAPLSVSGDALGSHLCPRCVLLASGGTRPGCWHSTAHRTAENSPAENCLLLFVCQMKIVAFFWLDIIIFLKISPFRQIDIRTCKLSEISSPETMLVDVFVYIRPDLLLCGHTHMHTHTLLFHGVLPSLAYSFFKNGIML